MSYPCPRNKKKVKVAASVSVLFATGGVLISNIPMSAGQNRKVLAKQSAHRVVPTPRVKSGMRLRSTEGEGEKREAKDETCDMKTAAGDGGDQQADIKTCSTSKFPGRFDVNGIAETVEGIHNSWYSWPREKADTDEIKKMGTYLLENHVRDFDWNEFTTQYLNVHEEGTIEDINKKITAAGEKMVEFYTDAVKDKITQNISNILFGQGGPAESETIGTVAGHIREGTFTYDEFSAEFKVVQNTSAFQKFTTDEKVQRTTANLIDPRNKRAVRRLSESTSAAMEKVSGFFGLSGDTKDAADGDGDESKHADTAGEEEEDVQATETPGVTEAKAAGEESDEAEAEAEEGFFRRVSNFFGSSPEAAPAADDQAEAPSVEEAAESVEKLLNKLIDAQNTAIFGGDIDHRHDNVAAVKSWVDNERELFEIFKAQLETGVDSTDPYERIKLALEQARSEHAPVTSFFNKIFGGDDDGDSSTGAAAAEKPSAEEATNDQNAAGGSGWFS